MSLLSYSSCFVTYHTITHSMLHTINCYQTVIKQFSKQITSDNHIMQLLQYGVCYASARRPIFSHIFCSWNIVRIVQSSFQKFANWLLELRMVCSTLFCHWVLYSITIFWISQVSFATITLCVASAWVCIFVFIHSYSYLFTFS